MNIPLCDRAGKVRGHALIDDADAVRIDCWRWHLLAGGYAARSTPRPDRRMVYMHREVVGLVHGDPRQVDHINGNRLDNRQENLRVVDVRGNASNRKPQSGTSRFRGVCWNKQRDKWRAQAGHEGHNHCIGDFDREADAARAIVEFWADRDLTAAQQVALRFADAMTEAERHEQRQGARARLLATFAPSGDRTRSEIGSRP